MSKKKERLPSVKVDVTVSANDVVAIKVAEFERYLMEEERSLKKKLSALDLEAKALKEKLDEEVKAVAESRFGKRVEDIKKAFASFHPKATIKVDVNARLSYKSDHYADEERGSLKKLQGVYAAFNVYVEREGRKYGSEMSAQESDTVKASKAVVDTLKALERNATRTTEVHDNMAVNRSEKNKIPALERAVRAAIAKEKLKDLGDDELMKLMRGVTLPGSKALPYK